MMRWGSEPHPLDHQSDAHPTEPSTLDLPHKMSFVWLNGNNLIQITAATVNFNRQIPIYLYGHKETGYPVDVRCSAFLA